jgi:hypothetical protein
VLGGVSNVILERLITDEFLEIIRKIEFICADKEPVETASRDEQMNSMMQKISSYLG